MPILSPGAGAVSALEQFLADREGAEIRKEELKLQQQQEKRIGQMQKEQLDLQKKTLESTLAERKRTGFEKELTDMLPGDVPTAQQIQTAKELGSGAFPQRTQQMPTSVADLAGTGPEVVPSPTTGAPEGGPSMLARPQPLMFRGTAPQRQGLQNKAEAQAYISSLPPGSPARLEAEHQMRFGSNAPASILTGDTSEEVFYQDPRTKQLFQIVNGEPQRFMGSSVPANARVLPIPAPAQEPTDRWQPMPVTDAEGNPRMALFNSVTRAFVDPNTMQQIPGVALGPTADMRNKAVARELVSASIAPVKELSEKIIQRVGPEQRMDAIARGVEAVFGNDPEFRVYSDAIFALAGNLAVAQQGSRPSDADIKAIWLPLVPNPYRDTSASAKMKWDIIAAMSGTAPKSSGGAKGAVAPVAGALPPGVTVRRVR